LVQGQPGTTHNHRSLIVTAALDAEGLEADKPAMPPAFLMTAIDGEVLNGVITVFPLASRALAAEVHRTRRVNAHYARLVQAPLTRERAWALHHGIVAAVKKRRWWQC